MVLGNAEQPVLSIGFKIDNALVQHLSENKKRESTTPFTRPILKKAHSIAGDPEQTDYQSSDRCLIALKAVHKCLKLSSQENNLLVVQNISPSSVLFSIRDLRVV